METIIDSSSSIPDSNNNNDDNSIKNAIIPEEKCEKYSLRPRASAKREDDSNFESWKPRSKSKRRPKQKPAPLSKYRRKTANARERCRMREINEGFEALRKALPHLSAPPPVAPVGNNNANNEKLTKISTLKLAMKYINALSRILHEPAEIESDGESFLSEYTLTPPDMSDQAFTPPTFSDHSLSTDFSDQLLSPEDYSDHQSHNTTMTASISNGLENSIALVSTNDLVSNCCFGVSDFVDGTLDTNSLANCCLLPEITFDDTAYVLDDTDYVASFT